MANWGADFKDEPAPEPVPAATPAAPTAPRPWGPDFIEPYTIAARKEREAEVAKAATERFGPPQPGDTSMAFQRGFTKGILPVVGPMIERGLDAATAGIGSVITGKPFAEEYRTVRESAARQAAQHPAAEAIGGLGGGVMGTVPVARRFPTAFGGTTLPGQMAAGAIAGGADAAVRHDGDPNAIKTGAAIGGSFPVIGSLLAPLGQGVSAATRWVADRTPGVRSVLQPKILPPPGAEIKQAAEAGYDNLSRGGVGYNPPNLQDLTTLTKRDIHAGSIGTPNTAPATHSALDDLHNMPPNPSSLHRVRLNLQEIINRHGASSAEGQSAILAKQRIEQFLEAPPPNAVVSGHMDARTVGARLREANENYKVGMSDEALQKRLGRGMVTAENQPVPFLAEGSFARNAIAGFRNDAKQAKFLSPEADAALAAAQRPGSMGEGVLRGISAATGSGRVNPVSALLAALPFGAGGGAAFGWPGVAAAAIPAAAGAGSSAATTALTRKGIENASRTIRAEAPYAQQQMRLQLPPYLSSSPLIGNMPPSVSPFQHRSEIVRLLAQRAAQADPEIDYSKLDARSIGGP